VAENWKLYVRHKHTIRNDEPISTCRPWNPVATKKVDPYTLSAIVNDASRYSFAWRNVKYKPKATVNSRAWIVFIRFWFINLWWAHVTVTPDASNVAVFKRGTLNGFSGLIPAGGHAHPISGVGAKLLWKNAQKNAKKNKTSDVINKIIPHRSPVVT
jgi:hypothetical protein